MKTQHIFEDRQGELFKDRAKALLNAQRGRKAKIHIFVRSGG